MHLLEMVASNICSQKSAIGIQINALAETSNYYACQSHCWQVKTACQRQMSRDIFFIHLMIFFSKFLSSSVTKLMLIKEKETNTHYFKQQSQGRDMHCWVFSLKFHTVCCYLECTCMYCAYISMIIHLLTHIYYKANFWIKRIDMTTFILCD